MQGEILLPIIAFIVDAGAGDGSGVFGGCSQWLMHASVVVNNWQHVEIEK